MPENTEQIENSESIKFILTDFNLLLGHLLVLSQEISKINNPEIKNRLTESLKLILEEIKKLQTQLHHNYGGHIALLELLKSFRGRVVTMQEELDALITPPLLYGYVVRLWPSEKMADVHINMGNERRKVNVFPKIDFAQLKFGQRVMLAGSNLAILSFDEEWEKTGQEATVSALLIGEDEGMVRVVTNFNETQDVILAEPLRGEKIREGDILLVSSRIAFKRLPKTKEIEHLFLAEVPSITYGKIGGLDREIKRIRELIEWPYLYHEKFIKHGLKPPKGILLFGPPGCGKTLTAKAVANALGQKTGGRSYFMNIKGPELLSKWVGETERYIREVFSRAKELATEKIPVIIFFDEMDALFPIRGSQISTDTAGTIVPQFTTEMDGVENLENVIIIGATNRQDRIDPAVIRPGRFDDRIEIGRPDKLQAFNIFNIYLGPANTILHPQYVDLKNYDGDDYIPKDHLGNPRKDSTGNIKKYPLAKDREKIIHYLINAALDRIFDPKKELNQLVKVRFASGREDKILYASDFISGSIIESIANKAKRLAFSDYIYSGENEGEEGLKLNHMMAALEEEFESQAKLPSVANPNEWAAIFGISEHVIDVIPLTEERRKKQGAQDKDTDIVKTGQYL